MVTRVYLNVFPLSFFHTQVPRKARGTQQLWCVPATFHLVSTLFQTVDFLTVIELLIDLSIYVLPLVIPATMPSSCPFP